MVRLSVYLDTSSWNHLLDGRIGSLRDAIDRLGGCIPCYSAQSIEELRGVRNEKKRTKLDLQLDELSAQFLETVSEPGGGMPTGYRISVKNREERDQIYKDGKNFSSVGGFGLGDLLQKFIGGIGSTSFEEVSEMALTDFERLLDLDVSEFPPELAATITRAVEAVKEHAYRAQQDFLVQLNQQDDIRIPQLDPAQINNFIGEGALERIIEVARSQDDTSLMIEEFFEQPPQIPPKRADAHHVSPSWEQVFRLAQLLFLLGYWREPKHRKDTERARIDFAGGQADICHIANASFCSVFHTSDKPQAHLAAAVYDHLNVSTMVQLYTPKSDTELSLYVPKSIQAIDC